MSPDLWTYIYSKMKKDNKLSLWERYLTNEIGIEFKSCLYFFAILFFYCVFKIINGEFEAGILHMAEMIFACYMIGYMQVYLFWNFDEANQIKLRESIGMTVCTVLYCLISYFGGWFEQKIIVTLLFAAYILLLYICVIFIYKTKRKIDDKKLNEELKLFQSEHKK